MKSILLCLILGASMSVLAAAQMMALSDPQEIGDCPHFLPEFAEATLDNGLRILVAERHDHPAVVYRVLVRAGSRHESTGQEGCASLTAALLTEGTQTTSSEEFAKRIDALGGRIWAQAGVDATLIGCDVLSEDINEGLRIFAEALLAPAFPKKALKRCRRELIGALQEQNVDPASVALTHMRALLFGEDQRLGHRVTGRSLLGLSRDDVQSFYDQHFLPNQSILVCMGDVDTEAMLAKLREQFHVWPRGNVPQTVPVRMEGAESAFRFVNMPRLTQAEIGISLACPSSNSPDRPAARLLNYTLGGGGFSSRLMKAIRSEGGMTYDITSTERYSEDFGYLTILTAVQNKDVTRAYEAIKEQLKAMSETGVTEEELAGAKSHYIGRLPLQLESPGDVAGYVLARMGEGLTLDEIRCETHRLEAVTLDSVRDLARRNLDPKNAELVIVGDGKVLRPSLGQIGRYEEVKHRTRVIP